MQCTQCGQPVVPDSLFCSNCGGRILIQAAPAPPAARPYMETHIQMAAYLNIALGALDGLIALGLFGFFSFLGLAIPHLDRHADPHFPFPLFFSGLGVILGLIFALFALPRVIGGFGLLRYRSWARILIVVVSIFGLLNFPIGTAIGIYSMWALLSRAGEQYYQQQAAA
jgi:hypothetical protein